MVDWFKQHATLMRVSRAISRLLGGYLCQNLAFLVNTERWLVILKQGNTTAFKGTICVYLLNALLLSALWLARWRYFEWLIVLTQGSINVSLFIKYQQVFSKIVIYHQEMLDRFKE